MDFGDATNRSLRFLFVDYTNLKLVGSGAFSGEAFSSGNLAIVGRSRRIMESIIWINVLFT